jgi:hypothetical protein
MGGTNKYAVSGWVVAVLLSFGVSIETGVLTSVGYLSQWLLKAPKGLNNVAASGISIVVAFGAFWLFNLHAPINQQFFIVGAKWVAGAIGIGSLAGQTNGAAATNSL